MNNYGYFVARNSAIHGMDPRSKIVAAASLSIVAFRADVLLLGFVTVILALIVLVSQLSLRGIYRAVGPALPFIVIVFLLHFVFSAGPSLLPFSLSPINVGVEGLSKGGILAWQLSLLLATGSLLNMTTPPSELARGIESLLRPVGVIGVSSQDLALMLSLALRFIPTVLMEAAQVREAQAARGANFSVGNPVRRLRNLSHLAVPLCIAVFRRCDDLVAAMEARGYDGGKRTGLRQLSLSTGDRIAIAASVAAVLAVFLFRRMFTL
jgi:biotin transport system permease protein